MTRSKQNGKSNRIDRAVARAHQAMVEWHTRADIRDKVVALADKAGQKRPHMHVGMRPAPVAHFIPMKARSKWQYCKGHHVIGVGCE